MKTIDISRELFSTPPYEDDPSPDISFKKSMEKGFEYNLSALSMCTHNATHIDAPLHFLKDGEDVEKIDLDKCFGACRVTEERFVSLSGAEALCRNTKRLLFRGRVEISAPAASLLASRLVLIGTEQDSIGSAQVHKTLLRAGVVILENLDLSHAPVGNYLLSALPLKIKGAEASPCRAVLIGE